MLRALATWLALCAAPAAAEVCVTGHHWPMAYEWHERSLSPKVEYNGPKGTKRQSIKAAWYASPSSQYKHGVLGDAIEPKALIYHEHRSTTPDGRPLNWNCNKLVRAEKNHVFEDTAPRLIDLDSDGTAEIITVRSHFEKGAQLAVYGLRDTGLQLIATTPYIGQRHRWLAPVGAADFDGDGHMEIAYVDRPHLAKTLRLLRWQDDTLTEIASFKGVSNHKIGEGFISGGIRHCAGQPEMIVASADWKGLRALHFDGKVITAKPLKGRPNKAGFAAALACK